LEEQPFCKWQVSGFESPLRLVLEWGKTSSDEQVGRFESPLKRGMG